MEAVGPWLPFGEDDRTLCRFTDPDRRKGRPRGESEMGSWLRVFSKEEIELDRLVTKECFIYQTNTVCEEE